MYHSRTRLLLAYGTIRILRVMSVNSMLSFFILLHLLLLLLRQLRLLFCRYFCRGICGLRDFLIKRNLRGASNSSTMVLRLSRIRRRWFCMKVSLLAIEDC